LKAFAEKLTLLLIFVRLFENGEAFKYISSEIEVILCDVRLLKDIFREMEAFVYKCEAFIKNYEAF
jgi:hypothetical protein